MQELERRLEQLPLDFDELPATSVRTGKETDTRARVGETENETAEKVETSAGTSGTEKEAAIEAGIMDTEADIANADGSTAIKADKLEKCENGKNEEIFVPSVESIGVTDFPTAVVPELSMFPSAVTVPSIKELPLSAILPQNGVKVESVTTVDTFTALSVYPSIKSSEVEEVSKNALSTSDIYPSFYGGTVQEAASFPQSVSHREAPAVPAKTRVITETVIPEAPPIYPTLVGPYELTDQGLLTENQLLAFYHNEIYENTDDFVASFIEAEQSPENGLFEYLKKYKEVCEKIALNEVDVAECEQLVKRCAANAWTAENRVLTQEGKCGEQKHATGSTTYLVATLHTSRLNELAQLLKRDVSTRLDSSLSLEIQARSLALQIQWMVVDFNSAFMVEHCLTADSPPYFIVDTDASSSRIQLRGAVSDAFHFLRFPALPSRFIDSVTGWISEMCAALLKASTSEDQQYLLCQILRLPSPVAKWAAPLLQPYVNMNPLNDRFVIDHFVAMLNILLSPIRGRENFLRRILNYENDDNSWAILSEDAEEVNAFLIWYMYSWTRQCSNAVAQVLTLVAFELVLLKTFNEGLRAYSRPEFRQFCKQIGYAMRQSVRCLADFMEIAIDLLSADEIIMVQKEFDRIILHTIYYIVGKQSLGLWQFLVDLPYSFTSESCRIRCQVILRSKELLTVAQLYEIPESELKVRARSAGSLLERLMQLPSNDSNYMVSALAAIISCSETNLDDFINELLNAVGVLIDKQPEILPRVLLLIDRNIDSLDQANFSMRLKFCRTHLLRNVNFRRMTLAAFAANGSSTGVPIILDRESLGMTLCISKRVLGSMNWGMGPSGDLWLRAPVHAVCAETIVKGHMAQCKNTNGLIAKSINKVTKLASKVPDYEQQFDIFCWDILLRLKLPILNDNVSPCTDLASFYMHIIQRSLSSVDVFLSKGLPLWTDLVNAGCYAPSCVVLARLIAIFPNATLTLVNNQTSSELRAFVYEYVYFAFTQFCSFVQTFDRLLHCDQSSYAVQLIAGSDQFPGPTLKLLSAAITYQLTDQYSASAVNAWTRLLCCKRATEWNDDKYALYLLGVIARLVFEKSYNDLQQLVELLQPIYMAMIHQWKEGSKGVLSWFSADESPPPLVASANLHIAPWASYLLLLAEQKGFSQFYEALYCSMGKHPKYTLEQAVKKAAGKSHFSLGVTRLHYYRWLELCCAEGVSESAVFPLACQQLVGHLFARKNYLATRICYGRRYFSCPASQSLFEHLRKTILPHAEQIADKDTSVYYKVFVQALGQWLSNSAIYERDFCAFDDLLLDHLLQFVVAGDLHPWTQFVDMNQLREQRNEGWKDYPRLYTNSTVQLSVILRCGNMFAVNKCTHPVTVTSAVTVSQYQPSVEAAMNDNRQKRSNEVATVFAQLLDSSAVHCAHLQYIAARMLDLSRTLSGMRAQQLQLSGRALFYQTTASVSSLEMISPASASTYTFVLTKLGQGFIANHAEEQTHLMSLVLGGSHLAYLLTAHFTPHCVPSSQLFSLYSSLSQAVRNPSTSSAALSLLSQLDIKKAGEKLPPHQFSQLMPIAFENIISIADPASPLYDICTKHFIHSLFHHFPDNFIPGLAMALAACDTNSTPVAVFNLMIDTLNANDLDSLDSKPEVAINSITATAASVAIAEQLSKSRRELSTRMYSVWTKYLDKVMVLAEFLLYKAAALSFDSEQPFSRLEAELRQQFGKCTQVFGPLIEPFGAGFAAWNPNDTNAAANVTDRFVSLMGRLHALYDTYLPPGSENLETLLFSYYAATIGQLARGGAHVHHLIETRLIRLPWNLFWPNLSDLALMTNILSEGAAESAPLITQIVVRIPWLMLIQQQACRASMPKLLDSLGTCHWDLIAVDQLDNVSSFIASAFPANALTDSDDVTISFLALLRRICYFSTVPSNVLPAAEEYQKQAIYVRTQLAIMQRNASDRVWAADFYRELIKTVNAIVISRGDTTDQPMCLPRELTAFWAHITDVKLGEALSKAFCDWLSENCESPLVLLTMRTVVDSLNASQVSTALKLVESCIATYFTRTGPCDWSVVVNCASLPNFCQQYLLTLPSSENGVTPQFLTLHAFMQKSLQNCTSAAQETTTLKSLLEYASGIKPKYVTNEAAFVLIIDKIVKLTLRQYGFGLQQGNESLMRLIDWLFHVHSDEKSSSFFSIIGLSKKQPFSVRIRYLCNVMELYLTQQTVAPDRSPRNAANTPVLNSRIQAFKDMSSSKLYAAFQSSSQLASPFFTKVQFYHIGHSTELFATVATSLFTEKFLQTIRYL
ncbi:unnamed protein product [Toxocara canis]|uniref:ANK_REP_REGION domain-containing protein n=1 Tax=Toxocara canis TaxID=6265 RepID=A0A183URS6_TOXCA|nr:unnamed protein product [Toxocara canis]